MAAFFGTKKVAIDFTPEEYELLLNQAKKKGMSVEQFYETHVKDKTATQDLDTLNFKIAKDTLFKKNDNSIKKLADL